MNAIFKPSKALMDNMRYPVKFGIIFLIVLVLLVSLSVNLISSLVEDVAFLENERVGLRYIQAVREPIEHLQQHRGMMAAYIGGSREFYERIMQKRTMVDEQFVKLKKVDQELGERLNTKDVLNDLMQKWEGIKNNSMNMTSAEAIKVHSDVIADMLALMGRVGDSSEISLDPKLDSYHMGVAIVASLPNLIENMGQARAVGSGVAANGSFANRSIYTKLAVLTNNINLYLKVVSSGLQASYEENPVIGNALKIPTDSNNSAVHDMQLLLDDKLLNADIITVGSDQVFNTATTVISGSYKLYDSIVPQFDNLLIERIDTDHKIINISIFTVICVLVLLAYLFIGFYLSVRDSITKINDAAEKIAAGDLTVRVQLTSRDEMSQVANSFNLMTEKFAHVISQILGSAQRIGSSSNELSVITEQTSKSIYEQQSQTEQVATAMNQMSATVQEVTRNINDTANAALQAHKETGRGGKVVDEAVQAVRNLAGQLDEASTIIHQLEQDSENINRVLDVIKGIADQTNLLALNAAIEAARAGEQGRGFAVVADEVRTLAGRTQESTKEINQVIEKLQSGSQEAVKAMNQSRDDAQSVVEQATKAGESLVVISDAVGRINDMSTQIASAADQQSATAEEVNRNIASISKMANETATGAKQTSASSETMARLGNELKELVAQFQV